MINDETLTLYYYRDGLSDSERGQVEAALEHDNDLALHYQGLVRDLESLGRVDDQPAPAAAVVRWRYGLDEAIARQSRRPGLRPLAWLFSAAAVLVLGIAIGMHLSGGQPAGVAQQIASTAGESPTPVGAASIATPPVTLTRGVAAYMHESRLQLVGLQDADAENRIELITHIIEQNRLFERAADANDAPDLARVLRAFEQVLVELAREEAGPRDINAKTDQLSFEYAVMLTKLTRDTSHLPTSL